MSCLLILKTPSCHIIIITVDHPILNWLCPFDCDCWISCAHQLDQSQVPGPTVIEMLMPTPYCSHLLWLFQSVLQAVTDAWWKHTGWMVSSLACSSSLGNIWPSWDLDGLPPRAEVWTMWLTNRTLVSMLACVATGLVPLPQLFDSLGSHWALNNRQSLLIWKETGVLEASRSCILPDACSL